MTFESPVLNSLKSWGWFFIGYIFIAITPWIFPTITEAVTNPVYSGILEVTIIIFEILFMILLPITTTAKAIFSKIEKADPIKETTISVIVMIFGILITYFGYFIITNNNGTGGMVSILEGTFQISLFWIGLILNWGATIILAPINNIIKVAR